MVNALNMVFDAKRKKRLQMRIDFLLENFNRLKELYSNLLGFSFAGKSTQPYKRENRFVSLPILVW